MSMSVEVEGENPAQVEVRTPTIWSKTTLWCLQTYRIFLAEVLSTSLLLFFGCSAVLPIPGFAVLPPMYGPFAFGLAVMLNIQIFGHISGAHMNPAVSIAAFIWGSLSFALLVSYIVAQIAGALLGYYIMLLIAPIDVASEGICMTLPYADLTAAQAFGMEAVLTGGLVLLCCGFWDPVNKQKQESLAIKFGMAVAGLSLAGAPLTGASLNPARSLAPAIFTGQWAAHWVYWAGPITGGIVAPLLYKYLWLAKVEPSNGEREPLKSS